MTKGSVSKEVSSAYEKGKGIFRLAPTWVPRAFLVPGRRLKLATSDLYKLGAERGGISERWFSSTTCADNGSLTPEDEGLSYIVNGGKRILLKDAIESSGNLILGKEIMKKWGGWKVYAKFFDDMDPIPHHLHLQDKFAKNVGREGKPESYYYPAQLNYTQNNFPYTFFGLEKGTTRKDIKQCLERWEEGDNGILDHSKAYRLKIGTGWLLPAGILHAPGTLVTFEVQWASDVAAVFQSMVAGRPTSRDILTKDVPPKKRKDYEYIVDLIDWEVNTDPFFKSNHYIEPILDSKTSSDELVDKWITYGKVDGKDLFSAKETTLRQGAEADIKDNSAYGLILVSGHGQIGDFDVESPAMIRYGELTNDELFVTAPRAKSGVMWKNTGRENMVVLSYYGPDSNPNAPQIGKHKK